MIKVVYCHILFLSEINRKRGRYISLLLNKSYKHWEIEISKCQKEEANIGVVHHKGFTVRGSSLDNELEIGTPSIVLSSISSKEDSTNT